MELNDSTTLCRLCQASFDLIFPLENKGSSFSCRREMRSFVLESVHGTSLVSSSNNENLKLTILTGNFKDNNLAAEEKVENLLVYLLRLRCSGGHYFFK